MAAQSETISAMQTLSKWHATAHEPGVNGRSRPEQKEGIETTKGLIPHSMAWAVALRSSKCRTKCVALDANKHHGQHVMSHVDRQLRGTWTLTRRRWRRICADHCRRICSNIKMCQQAICQPHLPNQIKVRCQSGLIFMVLSCPFLMILILRSEMRLTRQHCHSSDLSDLQPKSQ